MDEPEASRGSLHFADVVMEAQRRVAHRPGGGGTPPRMVLHCSLDSGLKGPGVRKAVAAPHSPGVKGGCSCSTPLTYNPLLGETLLTLREKPHCRDKLFPCVCILGEQGMIVHFTNVKLRLREGKMTCLSVTVELELEPSVTDTQILRIFQEGWWSEGGQL